MVRYVNPEFCVETVPATQLVRAERLDIIVKARFFEALYNARFIAEAESIYRKHILARTGGREPDDFRGVASPKQHIDDYVAACRELLSSMVSGGFDAAASVPVDGNFGPLNGAHRIACALALGLNVDIARFEGRRGLNWDMSWFVHHGFSKTERLRILFDLVRLTPQKCSVFVFWPHVIDRWNELTQSIRECGYDMAGYVDLAWPETDRVSYESLIYDLYSFSVADLVHGFTSIDRKIDFLREKPCFLRVGVCMQRHDGPSLFPGVSSLKSRMRVACADRVPVENFVTCHFADTPTEALHMARTLLLPESLRSAQYRRIAKPRTEFLRWLNEYRKILSRFGIKPEDCCIVGSAGLEIAGLRLATDIDFTTKAAVRMDCFGTGVTHFSGGVDLVSEGYHKAENGRHWPDDVLIDDPNLHVYFMGFKVANLAVIRDRKQYSKRPKDLLDVELIARLHTSDNC